MHVFYYGTTDCTCNNAREITFNNDANYTNDSIN